MKRIQFIITGLGPGGAERQLTGLAIMLNERGYDVEVCWYTDTNFYEGGLIENNIKCQRLYTTNNFKKLLNIWRAITCFKPDVVISFLDGPNTICPFLKIFNNRFKLVVSERNTTVQLDWRSRLRFALYKYADRIVPNSYSQNNIISIHYPLYKNKIITITNFTDIDFFTPKEKPNTIDKPTEILVASRVTESKNVKRFIRAIACVIKSGIDIRVKWFGEPFSQSYFEECKKLLIEEKIQDIFKFFPPTHNICAEYSSCDIVCIPSLHEGFPNVICEALSCGLPVACSDICDNSILVHSGSNGVLFDPYDVVDMAKKIEYICSLSLDEKRRMGRASRVRAEEILSKDVFIEKYINLINSL